MVIKISTMLSSANWRWNWTIPFIIQNIEILRIRTFLVLLLLACTYFYLMLVAYLYIFLLLLSYSISYACI